MFGLGTREIILLVVVIVLLFGSKQLPALARGITESIRHLRSAFKDDATVATDTKKR
jgi:sec-independent protein translocase protein TatA